MWRNYVTVGVRALAKNRAYAFINIVGLAIGMAACLLILLYVRYERSFDTWLPEGDRVFQAQTYYQSKTTSDNFKVQLLAYVGKAALQKDFPQIESAVYFNSSSTILLRDGQAIAIEDAHFVDGPFFDTIPLPLLVGNPTQALAQPGTAVFTEREAIKRFGTADIVGRTVSLNSNGRTGDYRVTGILKDLPKNSHLAINLLVRTDFPTLYTDTPAFLTNWGWNGGWVYVKLRPGADVNAINRELGNWARRNIPKGEGGGPQMADERSFALVAAPDVHLGQARGGAMTPPNDAGTITTFSVIALLILAMASINFTNLATARASQRAREVALRKVLGANRAQLIGQFLGESVLLAALAMLLGLAMAELALPWFAQFLDADLKLHYFGSEGMMLPIIALIALVGLVGGLYPAFYLSRFQPARVLKANKSAADAEGSGRLRSVLVVGQFAISIGLMVCTGVIYAQTVYARSVDPGFKREGLLQLNGVGSPELRPVVETMERQIAALPGVISVGRTGLGINTGNDSSRGVKVPGRNDPIDVGTYSVDAGFLPTMGMKLLAGRLFDANRPMDDSTTPLPENMEAERAMVARGANVVLNESGVKRLGFASPVDAMGKILKMDAGEKYGGDMNLTVIGVVADVRFRSVRNPLEPIMYMYERNNPYWMLVRYNGDPIAVRSRVEKIWQQFARDLPFNAEFSDEIIQKLYKRDDARAQLFAAFSLLAIIVGCLGLFGLAAFTAERRTKEIGIRKVLGARSWDIVKLLVWQFSRPVLIANLIAWPVAWWVMRDWLNGFDARISLGPVPFIAAGALALAIAIATITSHAVRVARANPIKALRYE